MLKEASTVISFQPLGSIQVKKQSKAKVEFYKKCKKVHILEINSQNNLRIIKAKK